MTLQIVGYSNNIVAFRLASLLVGDQFMILRGGIDIIDIVDIERWHGMTSQLGLQDIVPGVA